MPRVQPAVPNFPLSLRTLKSASMKGAVYLPIGADRQGRPVPHSRNEASRQPTESDRCAERELRWSKYGEEITNRSGALSRPLALSYDGALANRANDWPKDERDDSYTLFRSRRDWSVLQRVFWEAGAFLVPMPRSRRKTN